MLCIEKALELHELLAPYIPDIDEDTNAIKFINNIIHSIREAEDYDAYINSIALMMETQAENIINNSTPEEGVIYFAEGLTANKIFDLKRFMESLGWQVKQTKTSE